MHKVFHNSPPGDYKILKSNSLSIHRRMVGINSAILWSSKKDEKNLWTDKQWLSGTIVNRKGKYKRVSLILHFV